MGTTNNDATLKRKFDDQDEENATQTAHLNNKLKQNSTLQGKSHNNREALSKLDANQRKSLSSSKKSVGTASQLKLTREPTALLYTNTQKKRHIYNDNEDQDDIELENEPNSSNDDAESKIISSSPILSDSNKIQDAKITSEKPAITEKNDIYFVAEYSDDIFDHLYQRELETLPSHNYCIKNSHLKQNTASSNTSHNLTANAIYYRPSVRAILVDWLVEVHEKFQCFPETLYLAINIMDRFLSNNKVSTDKLQLVAVTSLFISAKFEEIRLPKLSEYAYITAGAATKDNIKKAELYILTNLKFNIGWPNPLYFLRRISKADNYDQDTRNIGKFLLEYTTCSPKFIDYKPSLVAAMSMFIARRITDKNNIIWDDTLKHYSGGIDPLTDSAFKESCKILITEVCEPVTNIKSLTLKYQESASYGNVLKTTLSWCQSQMDDKFDNFNRLFQ